MRPCVLSLVLVLLELWSPHVVSADGPPINYEIPEDLDAGTFIGNVVYDAGLDKKYSPAVLGTLRFVYLLQGIHKELFLLEERSGQLSTAAKLDRDELCPNEPDCAVRLDIAVQPAQYMQIIQVVIRILDNNDHAPVFPQSHVSWSLSESTGPGVLFPIEPATDPDSPANSVKGYELLSGGRKFELQIKHQPDGTFDLHLVLKELLDREDQETYRLKVVAFDGGVPSKSGSVIFTVTVLDTNDNSPSFDKPVYEVEVLENVDMKDALIQVHAKDPDQGDNGKVVYSFNAKTQKAYGDLFDVEQDTGKIFQKEPLDFEVQNSYSLTVVAHDQGPDSLPVTCRVQIQVLDQNDNKPEIAVNGEDGSGHIQILEHSEPETFIAHISVVDKDGGKNGEVTCIIDNPLFTLKKLYEADYKVVTKSDLDREMQGQHELLIKCNDLGSPAHSVETTLFVTVNDINDNDPKFSQPMYVASIRENNAMNEFIVQVWATDEDLGENGRLRYTLDAETSQYIHIDPRTGEVTANTLFDREVEAVRDLKVFAVDHGESPRTATATIAFNILDEDDEAPAFSTNQYTFDITENVPVRTEVGQVFAEDKDAPPHNQFSFYMDADQRNGETFSLDPQTGIIYSKAPLDREYIESYELIILVQSDHAPHMSDTTRVHITINDINDNEPLIYFPSQINNTVYLSNKAPIGYPVTQIKAYDPDTGDNGKLTYSLKSGNERGEFFINPLSGRITVHRPLREVEKHVFGLIVEVQDNGLEQHTVDKDLYVVVNSSLAVTPAPHTSPYYLPLTETEMAVVIGAGLGIMLVLVILIVVVCFLRRRKVRQRKIPPDDPRYWIGNDKGNGAGNRVASQGKHAEKNGQLKSKCSTDDFDSIPLSQSLSSTVDRKATMRTFQGSYEELPQDEDETLPAPAAISPVTDRSFSYWVKNADDNYYNNKLSSHPNSKTVRFSERKVNSHHHPHHHGNGGDPAMMYPPGGGAVMTAQFRKTSPRVENQDGILV